jgi:hypothetical protein
MENTDRSFDWEELLICIADKRVVQVIGKATASECGWIEQWVS